ncbi:MAG TPA: transaldolase, partial [Candidatus Saccharimonadaceae bacterium]|nr:transaldolase [Candidatus Saccharimonadaceae bacterium]
MTNLHRLHQPYNQSPWLDNLGRDLLKSGQLHTYIGQGIRGITSNPTILAKSVDGSTLYDEQIKRLAYEGKSTEDIYWTMIIDDIKSACDAFHETWEDSRGEDGYVSLEVSPMIAHNTDATVELARKLWKWVDKPNVMIKVPATDECIPAVHALLSEGININVTLLFSLKSYKKIAEAHAASHAIHKNTTSRSVASFFVSRIDTEVDKRLEAMGSDEALALRGKAALAEARLAYDIFLDNFAKAAVVDSDGAAVQRLLWASTSTKNPNYDDLLYVSGLIAPLTVNTMPEGTVANVLDHLPEQLESISLESIDDALQTVEKLRAVGIDFDDVDKTLENEGVKKFEDSFQEMLQSLE